MAYANVAGGDPVLASTINDIFTASLNMIVAQGNRGTASSTTSGATEMGIMRLDNLVLKNGNAYEFVCGNIRPSVTVAADHFVLSLKYSSAGAATTASAAIGKTEMTEATNSSYPQPTGWVVPGADTTTASVILTVARSSGTGTWVTNNDTGGIWLTVFCRGVAVADTGVDL